MKIYSILIILIISFCGCNSSKNQAKVKITVHATGSNGQTIAVKSDNFLSDKLLTISETKLDSTGYALLEFDLHNSSLFGFIKIGERDIRVLLDKGDDLDIMIDFKNPTAKLIFKGKAAEKTNYLMLSNAIQQKFEFAGSKFIFELDSTAFIKRYDSLAQAYKSFHQAFLDTTKLSNTTNSLLEGRNKINLLGLKQNYALGNYSAVKDRQQIPEFFRNVNDEIPIDTSFLNAKMGEYAQMLNIYIFELNIGLTSGKNEKEIELLSSTFPLKAKDKIKKSKFPDKIKELLHAENINFWISMDGITPSIKKMYENFTANSKSKDYITAITEKYNKYDAISEGKPAPDIVGYTPDGKKISLYDYKGKVVYVDVWATWCGPCREELPKTRLIENKYKDNDKVVFMYVSVDQNKDKWKELLKKDKSFKGVQINNIQDDKSIYKSYLIAGIPRYILIDANGKIINAYAPRPSSRKVEGLIDQALSKI